MSVALLKVDILITLELLIGTLAYFCKLKNSRLYASKSVPNQFAVSFYHSPGLPAGSGGSVDGREPLLTSVRAM